MSIKQGLKLVLLSALLFIFSGCAGDRQPKVTQFNSGIEKTKRWKEYNDYAKANDKPILDFAATTLEYKFNKGTILSYDNFLASDPKVTIETKWENCKPSDIYEFKFYMPDGRLYEYNYFRMKKLYTKYTVGRSMDIKGLFPAKIQGKWKVKIYANKKFVVSKEFTIGKSKKYKEAKTDEKIGIFPYLDDKELSTWKHAIPLSRYISWAILYNYKNVEVSSPYQLRQDLGNPNISYKNFKKFINEDLMSSDSIILNAAQKHSLDYIVLGRVQSYWQNGSSNTKVDTFIINVKKKQIINEISSLGQLNRNDYGIGHQDRVRGFHPNRIKIYKQIYKNIDISIRNIVR